jgi:hypothetical protein
MDGAAAQDGGMHRIGIDIGRVIIGPVVHGKADTSFLGSRLEDALRTPPAEGAIAGVADLVARTDGAAWLVSKCGPGVQAKTRAWLDHHAFWRRTGMDRSHLRFCLKRPEKAVHARQLRLTAMIDDRVDVLSAPRRARRRAPAVRRAGPAGAALGDPGVQLGGCRRVGAAPLFVRSARHGAGRGRP